ncbi:hypothetical protein LZ30DRAFT_218972 [Colletotrichum cereale]|nr:hypothetical protein LZ30DRAFT_218972 [Colletotrichum cereale]
MAMALRDSVEDRGPAVELLAITPSQVTTTPPSPDASIEDNIPLVDAIDDTGSVSSFRAGRFADKDLLSGWFPQIERDENSSWGIWFSKRSRALMVQISIISTILITNLAVTIFAYSRYGSKNGVGLIYQGDCSTIKRLDQWIHLLINLLGTGMLAASNFCMQLQAAPTRKNVDFAHEKGKWMDIGIPSLRNLRYLDNWQRASWALLALSSIPIHLIYNSAVFQSLSSHNYTVAVVKDSFLNGSSWDLETAELNRAGDWGWNDTRVNPLNLDYQKVIQDMQNAASTYERLNISACFDLYDDYWKPQGDAIILVRNESVQSTPDDSLLMYVSIVPRLDDWAKNMWALGNGSGGFLATSPPKPVTKWFLGPNRYEVTQCLVQPASSLTAKCRFEYSPPIMITIVLMNLIKVLIMLSIWIARRRQRQRKQQDKAQEVLSTLGDAIASFMREPCKQTVGMGLATKYDFLTRNDWTMRRLPSIIQKSSDGSQIPPVPRAFKTEAKQWRSAASLRRWAVLLLMCVILVVTVLVLLSLSFVSLRRRRFKINIPELWKLGFGALTPFTYLYIGIPKNDPVGLILNVILANMPQLVLSVLYILCNMMLSTFLLQREFSRLCDTKYRKPLRVSEPVGIQRSSYFISLPLRYGIPLSASSTLMHWLISQSLFLARIRAVLPDGRDDEINSFSTCGYSPIALLFTLVTGIVLLLALIGLGLRRYDGTMRMVSTNSLAISAACHVLPEDRDNGYVLPVQWAVVEMKGGVGKCAMTAAAAGTLKLPRAGLKYK